MLIENRMQPSPLVGAHWNSPMESATRHEIFGIVQTLVPSVHCLMPNANRHPLETVVEIQVTLKQLNVLFGVDI